MNSTPVITMNLRDRSGRNDHKTPGLMVSIPVFLIIVSSLVFAIYSGLLEDDRRESQINAENRAKAKFQEEAPEVVYR
jgi:hypothetical protein